MFELNDEFWWFINTAQKSNSSSRQACSPNVYCHCMLLVVYLTARPVEINKVDKIQLLQFETFRLVKLGHTLYSRKFP